MSTLPRPFFHDSPAGSTLPILHPAQCATSLPSGVRSPWSALAWSVRPRARDMRNVEALKRSFSTTSPFRSPRRTPDNQPIIMQFAARLLVSFDSGVRTS